VKRELDHAGVADFSLDRRREAFARPGFRLTAIRLTQEARSRELVPGSFVPSLPSSEGFGMRVASLDDAKRCLESNGVRVQAGKNASLRSGAPAGLWVALGDACGAAIEFRQAENWQ
jgi:hypothetical protein